MPDAYLENKTKINKYYKEYRNNFDKRLDEKYEARASQHFFELIEKSDKTGQYFDGVNQGNGSSFDVWLVKDDKPVVMLGEDRHLYIGNNINRVRKGIGRGFNTYNKDTIMDQNVINLIYAKEVLLKKVEKLQQDYNNKHSILLKQSEERVKEKLTDKEIKLTNVEQQIAKLTNQNNLIKNKFNRYQGILEQLQHNQNGTINTIDKDGLEDAINNYQKNTEKIEKLTKEKEELEVSIKRTKDTEKIKPTSEMEKIQKKIQNHKNFIKKSGYIDEISLQDLKQGGFKDQQQFDQFLKDYNNLHTLKNTNQLNPTLSNKYQEFKKYYNKIQQNENIKKYLDQQKMIDNFKKNTIDYANAVATNTKNADINKNVSTNKTINTIKQNKVNNVAVSGKITTNNIGNNIENITNNIQQNKEKIVNLQSDIQTLQDKINGYKNELNSIQNVSLDTIKLPSFEEAVSNKKEFLKSIKNHNSTINSINKDTNKKIETKNKLRNTIINLENQLHSKQSELNYYQNQQNILQKQQNKIQFNKLRDNILGNKEEIVKQQKQNNTTIKNNKKDINIEKLNTLKTEYILNNNQTQIDKSRRFLDLENSISSINSNDQKFVEDLLSGNDANNSFVSKNTNKPQIKNFNYSITSTNSISVPAKNTYSISQSQGFALGGDKK